MQLVKSRRRRGWNPQLVCGMESTRSVECNQSEGEIHADAWCHTPSAITYSPAVRLHANPSDWIEKRPFENGLFSWCERRDLNPYGVTTRPSNVRVCQFRHSRIPFCWSRKTQQLYYTRIFTLVKGFSAFSQKISKKSWFSFFSMVYWFGVFCTWRRGTGE